MCLELVNISQNLNFIYAFIDQMKWIKLSTNYVGIIWEYKSFLLRNSSIMLFYGLCLCFFRLVREMFFCGDSFQIIMYVVKLLMENECLGKFQYLDPSDILVKLNLNLSFLCEVDESTNLKFNVGLSFQQKMYLKFFVLFSKIQS